jgi:predicted transglutaminase-like cysteine proteinase
VVSTVASGVGFGAGKLVSSAAANVTSNISSQAMQQTSQAMQQTAQAMQQTAQGAIVGGAAGASGSIAANVTGQVFDLARGKTDDGKAKENFDFGSLVKDTLIGGITGAAAGAAIGYGNSKFGAKISKLDEKVNNSIKQTTNKVIDAAKRILKDESGSVIFGGKGNNTGVGSNTPKAEIVDKNNRTFAGDKGTSKNVLPKGTLTETELEQLQNVAKKYNTEIKVVGSRATGDGRNINTNNPVGKGPGTKSDIDVLIDKQLEIDTRGQITDDIINLTGGTANVLSRDASMGQAPYISIKSDGSVTIINK